MAPAGTRPEPYRARRRRRGARAHAGAARALAVAAVCLALAPSPGRAQGPAETPAPLPPAAEAAAPPAEPAPVPVPEIATASERAIEELRGLAGSLPGAEIDAVAEELGALRRELAERYARVDALVESANPAELDEAERRWAGVVARLEPRRSALTQRAAELEAALARVAEIERRWRRTRRAALEASVPDPVLARVDEVLGLAAQTRAEIERVRQRVLTVQGEVAQEESRARAVVARLRERRAELRRRIFVPDAPPLWTAAARARAQGGLAERVGRALAERARGLGAYVRDQPERAAVQALLALALGLLGRALGRRMPEAPEGSAVAAALRRPWSTGALAALAVTRPLHPLAPPALADLAALLAIVPALRLLPPIFGPGSRRGLALLAALFALAQIRQALALLPVTPRLLLCVEAALLAGGILEAERAGFGRAAAEWLRAHRGARVLWRTAGAMAVAALPAAVLGFVAFATFVADGLRMTALGGVLVATLARLALETTTAVLRGPARRALRSVAARAARIERRAGAAIRVAAWLAWIALALDAFGLLDAARAGLAAAFAAEIRVGAAVIAVGAIAALLAVGVVTVALASAARVLLEEDLLAAFELPRGVAHAVARGTQYAILLAGTLLALAAGGIDLGRFTLLAGALGVGVGFGLQNIVNNFVSGLILLFERPIQIGDTVQVGDLLGDVRRIGVRSSTIRTWSGAEVIVPNSQLISERVTNWTLSDRLRRLDVRVGVAYGTDPRRVLELLERVAREHPRILAFPPPVALFLAFGESSLDFELRAWTSAFEDFPRIQSEIAIAIYEALEEAGIQIPFPQRDLHVRSVAPEILGRALAAEGAAAGRAPRERAARAGDPPEPLPEAGDRETV